MKGLPRKAQAYILSVTLIAFMLLVYYSVKMTFSRTIIEGLVFFSILVIFTEWLKVDLPKGGVITVTFAIAYTCMLLFGATAAGYVTITGYVVSVLLTRDESPWYKVMFNCAQYVICPFFAEWIYISTGGVIGQVNPLNIMPLITSTIGCFLLNHIAISVILSMVQGSTPWRVWITNYLWTIPNMFALSILGILMAGIYSYTGYWGVSIFFVPLLLARFIFKSYMEIREVYLNTLEALASALDAKDTYTRGHSERVAQYAVKLAEEMKLPGDTIEAIEHTALLHDIGKIGVRDELLTRKGRLTADEFDLVKAHSVIGANIVKDVHNLGDAVKFIRHHHEKFDGSGYPDRLKGDEIPLEARIIALADSFDAMTTNRSYRNKMTEEEALREVKHCAGSQFDPTVAEALIRCMQVTIPSVPVYNSMVEAVPIVEK